MQETLKVAKIVIKENRTYILSSNFDKREIFSFFIAIIIK